MSEIKSPEINSQQKGLQIQLQKKFSKEAKRTIAGQMGLEKHKDDTAEQVVEMFLEFAKGDINKMLERMRKIPQFTGFLYSLWHWPEAG